MGYSWFNTFAVTLPPNVAAPLKVTKSPSTAPCPPLQVAFMVAQSTSSLELWLAAVVLLTPRTQPIKLLPLTAAYVISSEFIFIRPEGGKLVELVKGITSTVALTPAEIVFFIAAKPHCQRLQWCEQG